jgi:hypothetical protein
LQFPWELPELAEILGERTNVLSQDLTGKNFTQGEDGGLPRLLGQYFLFSGREVTFPQDFLVIKFSQLRIVMIWKQERL